MCKSFLVLQICLQFPDDLICYSTSISQQLSANCDSQIFVLGDTSYGSCCVDEIAAAHIKAEAIIHFGHACLSKITRLPVLYIFLKLNFDTDTFIKCIEQTFLDKQESIKIFYDSAYLHKIGTIVSLTNLYSNIDIGKLAITCESDILCWSMPNLDVSNFTCIYIGRDNQSFFNLSTSIKAKVWWLYNPRQNTIDEISPLKTNWMKKRYYYIEKCKDAHSLGIVVGTLSTEGYLNIVKHIQNLSKKHGIRSYIISVGKINPAKLANFAEIDCFVLVGCPENTIYNSRDFYKPLITVFELEMALNPAWHLQLPETYCSDFKEMLPNGKLYRDSNGLDVIENDVSLVSGRIRNKLNDCDETMQTNGSLELLERGNNDLSVITSSDTFAARSWQGLDPALGKNEPAQIEMGRSGLAMKYSENVTDQ